MLTNDTLEGCVEQIVLSDHSDEAAEFVKGTSKREGLKQFIKNFWSNEGADIRFGRLTVSRHGECLHTLYDLS